LKPRRISHFSCGAASAVATKLSNPDEIWYAQTGAEHEDNERFLEDCETWFGKKVKRIRNPNFDSTWAVWESRKYLSGISGAPCTGELKIKPQLEHQLPDDIHIFGYTYDSDDIRRSKALLDNWPELTTEYPLIERKAACLSLLHSAGVKPPITYEMGLPNANCIPCVKASSPAYWALIREKFPEQFWKMASLELSYGARLTRIKGVRCSIVDIPQGYPTVDPIAPACDFLCSLTEQELMHDEQSDEGEDDD